MLHAPNTFPDPLADYTHALGLPMSDFRLEDGHAGVVFGFLQLAGVFGGAGHNVGMA